MVIGVAGRVMASGSCALTNGALLYSKPILVGATPAEIHVPIPSTNEVLVTATSRDLDFRLEQIEGPVFQAADNPVRRLGARRIVVATGVLHNIGLRIVSKEQASAHGTVRVQMAPISTVSDEKCRAAFRLMASGDQHYARSQISLDSKGAATSVDARAEYRAAAQDYSEAADALRTHGADPLLAQASLSLAAVLYQNLQAWQNAQDAAGSARETFTFLSDTYGEARATAMGTAADMELALASKSSPSAAVADALAKRLASDRQTFLDLGALHQRRREFFDQALALNNAGLADYYAGDFDLAITDYHRALPIYVRLGEKPRQAQVLQNIAVTEYELGRFSLAKEHFARALELGRSDSRLSLRGEMLNNLAVVEWASGELDTALQHHEEALAILTRFQSAREQARSLHGIGLVYYAAGDTDQALDYLSRAIQMRDPKTDPRGRTASLRARASVLSDLHQLPEAIRLRREALELAGSPIMRVRIETQLAADLHGSGDTRESRELIDRAVNESSQADSVHALALRTRAELEYEDQDLSGSEADVSQALQLLRNTEAPAERVAALSLGARIAQSKHDIPKAELLVQQALGLAEQVRLQSSNPELRAGVWQSLRPVFDLGIQLQVEQAQAGDRQGELTQSALALHTLTLSEMSRARSLADYQGSHSSGMGEQDSSDAQLLRALYREIADRRFELEVRTDRNGETDPHNATIRADIDSLRRRIDSLHRLRPGVGGPLSDPAAMSARLQKIAVRIPADAAVIEYWRGSHESWAWVVTNKTLRMVSLGSSEHLEQVARALHHSLRDFGSVSREERMRLIGELSDLLVAPLLDLVSQEKTLIFVPDGTLHYVPFAALGITAPSGVRPLVAEHSVLTIPSLLSLEWKTTLVTLPTRTLIVADPVYSDSDARLAKHGPDTVAQLPSGEGGEMHRFRSPSLQGTLERLPATTAEAQSIQRLLEPSTVDSLIGFNAAREALLRLDLSQYRIIHFATHGVADTQAPQLSAVILSLRTPEGETQPGEVFAGEFLLRKLNAELVTLSACDTALGREVAGEGLLGLRYAVHAAGARSVIASLWELPDRTAADIMATFYEHYIKLRQRPADALSVALRTAWQSLDDPALWSAFEISSIGEDALLLH